MIIKSLVTSLAITAPLMAAKPEVNLHLYTSATVGSADINEAVFATHAHDPNDSFTLQGIELNAQIKFNDIFSTNITYNGFLDEDDNLTGEWEDAYLSANLLDSALIINAGRVFNHTSNENHLHVHSLNFVNASLLTTRFNGEEGLLTESVQLTWKLPVEHTSAISFSYGDAVEHSHEEEAGALPTDVHGDESFLAKEIFNVSIRGTFLKDDFNHFNYHAYYATGDNGYGLDASNYGGGVEYLWREKGQEEGGKYFAVGAEIAHRSLDFSSEDGTVTGSHDETGYALSSRYGFGNDWEVAARFEHVEGSNIIEETPELDRFSLALTKGFNINDKYDGHVRLQFDHIDSSEDGDGNAGWLQFQFNFGPGQ